MEPSSHSSSSSQLLTDSHFLQKQFSSSIRQQQQQSNLLHPTNINSNCANTDKNITLQDEHNPTKFSKLFRAADILPYLMSEKHAFSAATGEKPHNQDSSHLENSQTNNPPLPTLSRCNYLLTQEVSTDKNINKILFCLLALLIISSYLLPKEQKTMLCDQKGRALLGVIN